MPARHRSPTPAHCFRRATSSALQQIFMVCDKSDGGGVRSLCPLHLSASGLRGFHVTATTSTAPALSRLVSICRAPGGNVVPNRCAMHRIMSVQPKGIIDYIFRYRVTTPFSTCSTTKTLLGPPPYIDRFLDRFASLHVSIPFTPPPHPHARLMRLLQHVCVQLFRGTRSRPIDIDIISPSSTTATAVLHCETPCLSSPLRRQLADLSSIPSLMLHPR